MPTLHFPLVGSFTNRNSSPSASKDQQFVNCYPEVTRNPVTGKQSVYLYKRPGYTAGSAYSGVGTSSNGIVVWSGNTATNPPIAAGFVNSGGTSTSVWNLGTATKIGGDIATTSGVVCLTETVVSGTANLVGNFVDSGTGAVEQWYFPEGGAWTQVTDGDFPSNICGAPAHLDGYVFNMTLDGRVWNSDLNSVSSYTANNYFTTNAYPDKGVAVARQGNTLVAFGELTMEFLENAGNATGSPLKRVGSLSIGAARSAASESRTVLSAHGTIFWMGTTAGGGVTGIYRLDGLKPEKISTPAIDKLLAAGALTRFLGSMVLHGMRHVVLHSSSTGTTYVYCLETNYWWILALASGTVGACVGVNYLFPPVAVTFFVGPNLSGNQFSISANQDDSSDFTMTVQTDNMDADTDKRKFWRKIRVSYDRQSSTSNLGVAWSDDDFANYSTARNIDTSGNSSWLAGLGSSARRSWKFTNTANTPCRIHAVEIEYDVAT